MKKLYLSLLTIFLTYTLIYGDCYLSPYPKKYYSKDSTYILTIIPKMSDAVVTFYKSPKCIEREMLGNSIVDKYLIKNDSCVGILSKRVNDTVDSICWKKRLLNSIAPENVYIFVNGKFIITFDDWGPNFNEWMAIYNSEGLLYRKYELDEFMPDTLRNKINSWYSGFIINEDSMNMIFEACLVKRNLWQKFWGGETITLDTFKLDLINGKLIGNKH